MDHVRQTVETFIEKVEQQERELIETKKTVNLLLKALGESPRYNLEPEPDETPIVHGGWRSDEFYGQSLTSVVRTILLARKAAKLGAVSVNEIYAAMQEGGYDFGNQDDEAAKHGLRASLRKNTAVFHRLPSGLYGLKEWYPHAKERKPVSGTDTKEEDDVAETPKTDVKEPEVKKTGTKKPENKERGPAPRNGESEPGEPIPF